MRPAFRIFLWACFVIGSSLAVLIFLLVLYYFFIGIISVELSIGLLGLALGIVPGVAKVRSHLLEASKFEEEITKLKEFEKREELETIAPILKYPLRREIVLSLLDEEPVWHPELLHTLKKRIPDLDIKEFENQVNTTLKELIKLEYLKCDDVDYREGDWIIQIAFLNEKKRNILKNNRQLMERN